MGADTGGETGEIPKVVSLSKKGNTLGMLRDLFLVLGESVCKHAKGQATRNMEGWARNWDLSVNPWLL